MNNDMEQLLGQVTVRGVRPELRSQILAAVEDKLQDRSEPPKRGPLSLWERVRVRAIRRKTTSWGDSCTVAPGGGSTTATPTHEAPASPWLRRCALSVAASLLVGIGMNVWASKASERHLAQLFGPPPISKRAMELAKMVESVTDSQTAQRVYQQLAVPCSSSPDALAKQSAVVAQLIRELQTVSKGSYHETPQKDSQMDRDHPGRAGGDTSGYQYLVRANYRYTA